MTGQQRWDALGILNPRVKTPAVADHGEMPGERNFRFSKYCLFESSVRVAGAKPPVTLPGCDLLAAPQRAGSFCEFHDGGSPACMWRNTDWKLILFFERPLAQGRAARRSARRT